MYNCNYNISNIILVVFILICSIYCYSGMEQFGWVTGNVVPR